jgi:hypothetical protein
VAAVEEVEVAEEEAVEVEEEAALEEASVKKVLQTELCLLEKSSILAKRRLSAN